MSRPERITGAGILLYPTEGDLYNKMQAEGRVVQNYRGMQIEEAKKRVELLADPSTNPHRNRGLVLVQAWHVLDPRGGLVTIYDKKRTS